MKKPSIGFWVIAALFLLWNVIGCGLYLVEVTMTDAQYAEAYGEAMAAARDFYPAWAVAAYAVAVWGGLLGAILLLLRRGLSVTLFSLSVIAAVIGFIPSFISAPLREAAGTTFWVMPVIVVFIGLVEVWFARRSRANGMLR
jgi:hypothetical protein